MPLTLKKILKVILVCTLIFQLAGIASATPQAPRTVLMVERRQAGHEEQGKDTQRLALYIAAQLTNLLEGRSSVIEHRQSSQLLRRLQEEAFGRQTGKTAFVIDARIADLIAARRAYFGFHFEDCDHHLETIRAALAGAPSFAYVADALPYETEVLTGLCALARQNEPRAVQAFSEAIRLRPEESLDPALYSPEAIGLYQRLKDAPTRSAAGSGSLAVSSIPPFAKVFINGDFRGQTPLTLNDLPLGTVYVRLSDEQYADAFERVVIAPNPQRISIALRPQIPIPDTVDSQNSLEEIASVAVSGDAEDFTAVAQVAGVERLALVQIDSLGWDYRTTLRIWDRASKKVSEQHSEDFVLLGDSLPAALERLAATQGVPLPVIPAPQSTTAPAVDVAIPQDTVSPLADLQSPPPFAQSAAEPDRPLYKRWWVWAIAGVVLAGAAAGTAVALGQGSEGGGARIPISGPSGNPTTPGVWVGQSGR